jgi:hypothetical protein
VNAEETAQLLMLIAEFCPQQTFTPADPDHHIPGSAAMWASLLDDVSLGDAKLAVKRLVKKQRFVAVSEVIETVAAIRAERLDAMPQADRPVPNIDPEDGPRYVRAVRAIEKAIADGEIRSDGAGGFILENPRWQGRLAIESGPTVKREVDYSQVFGERRRVLAEQAATRKREAAEREASHDAERRERERQQAALLDMQAAYDKAREGKLRRKRKLSKTITKSLADSVDGATMEPQAARDAAAS